MMTCRSLHRRIAQHAMWRHVHRWLVGEISKHSSGSNPAFFAMRRKVPADATPDWYYLAVSLFFLGWKKKQLGSFTLKRPFLNPRTPKKLAENGGRVTRNTRWLVLDERENWGFKWLDDMDENDTVRIGQLGLATKVDHRSRFDKEEFEWRWRPARALCKTQERLRRKLNRKNKKPPEKTASNDGRKKRTKR